MSLTAARRVRCRLLKLQSEHCPFPAQLQLAVSSHVMPLQFNLTEVAAAGISGIFQRSDRTENKHMSDHLGLLPSNLSNVLPVA